MSIRKKIKSEAGEIRKAVKETAWTYIAAAFGLVAGLAWNEAIKAAIEYYLPLNGNTVIAKFIYAIAITLIVVLSLTYLERILKIKASGAQDEDKSQS